MPILKTLKVNPNPESSPSSLRRIFIKFIFKAFFLLSFFPRKRIIILRFKHSPHSLILPALIRVQNNFLLLYASAAAAYKTYSYTQRLTNKNH